MSLRAWIIKEKLVSIQNVEFSDNFLAVVEITMATGYGEH